MSLKATLAARGPATAEFPLRVEDDSAAQRELAAARSALLDAPGDEDARRRVDAAEAAVDACYETILVTALPPVDWEDLLGQHPPSDEDAKKGAWCDQVTFVPALLAACIDSDVTADDWADYTTKGALSPGEVDALTGLVVGLHTRAPDPRLGKGTTGIRS